MEEILIFLVQHGEAKQKEEDPERGLTEKGKKDSEKVAKFLSERGIRVKGIYHSGKKRAEETALIYAEFLKPLKLEKSENMDPPDEPFLWANKIKDIGENIMLVGHLPHLSKLASLLLTGNPEKEIIKFEYGSILALEKKENFKIKFFIIPSLI